MGLFDFLKKKDKDEVPPSTWLPTPPPVHDYDRIRPTVEHFTAQVNKSDLKRTGKTKKPDLTHLDENGELPWGWLYHNREFTEKIEKEFSYFLNRWISSRGKGASTEYAALKSLILYIKDAGNLCDSKGECYSKWFSDCVADQKYLAARESDLKHLQTLL